MSLTRKTYMHKIGPKAWWPALRAKLKVRFERAGLTRCEIGYVGCKGGLFLGFAHSKKRRNITTQAEREEVALACVACHQLIEIGPEAEMTQIVREIIAKRETAV